ncbi:hypothetical protein N1851_028580 [Merluccius polli]|uniref:Uncharacterized protein n=1 Tax=Merluccius polli TaxID=89951 RepID=A0AA47NTE3_MERPO|nr:hypothetical protein N1851_028580 [Merluccius polli]
MSLNNYADDTHLYLALTPNYYSPIERLCLETINNWMCQNVLQFNKESVLGAKEESLNVEAYTSLRPLASRQLQIIKNTAARVFTRTKKAEHPSSDPSCETGSLIDFEIALFTYKSLNGLGPKYMMDMLAQYQPSRPLRPSVNDSLWVPRLTTKHVEATPDAVY